MENFFDSAQQASLQTHFTFRFLISEQIQQNFHKSECLIRKLQTVLLRPALLTILRSFLRPFTLITAT